jgi:hypothetical protein
MLVGLFRRPFAPDKANALPQRNKNGGKYMAKSIIIDALSFNPTSKD